MFVFYLTQIQLKIACKQLRALTIFQINEFLTFNCDKYVIATKVW